MLRRRSGCGSALSASITGREPVYTDSGLGLLYSRLRLAANNSTKTQTVNSAPGQALGAAASAQKASATAAAAVASQMAGSVPVAPVAPTFWIGQSAAAALTATTMPSSSRVAAAKRRHGPAAPLAAG